MTKLPKAAQGNRRGVLEVIQSIPALCTHMGKDASSTVFPLIATYAPLGIVPLAVSLAVVDESLQYGLVAILVLLVLALLVSLLEIGTDITKKRVAEGLKEAAEDAVEGKDVRISSYLRHSVYVEQYVEKLTERQQRWIARRWEKEFSEAAFRATEPEGQVAQSIDALLDTDRIKAVRYHKKALEELQSVSQQKSNGFAEFDGQLRAQHP